MTTTAQKLNVLTAGDPGYDEARSIWNAMVDRRPALIVRAACEADVVAAVRLARERGLELGVRCGGHNAAGFAVPEGGLMLDLTRLAAVRVDPARRRARVQGGALLGVLDTAAQRHGLATTAGNVSHTGVGGLTLGGGMGWLARQYGLACDNVVSYRVVTAAGEVLTASAREHPELFWGLRGGGGNFGVVTEFEFRLHPVGTRALVAEYAVDPSGAAAALRHWRDLAAVAPRPATLEAVSPGDGSVRLGFVWAGPGDPAGLLAEMPAATVREVSYLHLQTRDDTTGGHAYRRYSKGHYLRALPDAAVDAFLTPGPAARSLQTYGGAIADVAPAATAFAHRDTLFEFGTGLRWTDPAEDAERMAVARATGALLAPYASGVYVNVLNDEGEAGVRRAYPAAQLARLTAVKDAYDPDNVFHLNHNIRPSVRP
ncbi:FAD-binding oxidoreductase [Dactylosporangium sp. NPDC049140]|uniref:FAD-binding oxidoreductase n=1 Tax=Dactylosporangium sp. NPDC049140 TaxID=3155647 RepID=UPI0033F4BA6E